MRMHWVRTSSPMQGTALKRCWMHTNSKINAGKGLAEVCPLACKGGPRADGEHAMWMEPAQ